MSVFFEKKKIVIPGETLTEGTYNVGPGTYKDMDLIRASIIGLPEIKNNYVSVIPLQGAYINQ